MKKYLIAGTLASVLGGLFASCQHDEIAGSLVEAKVEAYKEVFKQEFGTIDSNQDWGFGTSTQSKSRAYGRTRALSSSWDKWATAPQDADFAIKMPGDEVELNSENYGQGTTIKNYKLQNTTETQAPNVWNGNFNIYVEGTKSLKFTNPGDGADNMRLYVLPGANLTFTDYFNLQKPTSFKMYIAEGATVTFANGTNINIQMYNRGTVIVNGNEQCGAYGQGIIYNQGTMSFNSTKTDNGISGALVLHNNESQLINEGVLNSKGLRIEGTGHFKNVSGGEVNISGHTIVNSNDCSWINDGLYNTVNYYYTAGSSDVINLCRLNVSELFYMDLGDTNINSFKMDAGSGVVATNFWAKGPGYITMGAGSLFKVTNTATMDYTNADYGIYGPSTGEVYAVFQAKDIKTSNINQGFDVTYGGKLAIVADTHFDSNTGFTSNDGQADHPIIAFANGCSKDNIYINGSYPNISIAASTCNPGFGSITIPTDDPTTGKVKVETTTEVYTTTQLIEQGRVFCEDLGRVSRNDLDFNDVVFDAYIYEVKEYTKTTVKKGGTIFSENEVLNSTSYKANIILLAAGGTYPLTVAGTEVHTALGASSTNVIVNTCSSDEDAYSNPYINTSSAKDLGYIDGISSIKDIPVIVKYTDAVHELSAEVGEAPQKFCINAIGTKWAKERKQIKEAYTSFKDWVNNSSIKFWDGDKNESLLYNCSWDTYTNRSTEIVSETKSSTTVETEEDGATTGGYDNGPVLTRRNH
jgi:hypothetical protein